MNEAVFWEGIWEEIMQWHGCLDVLTCFDAINDLEVCRCHSSIEKHPAYLLY